MTHFYVMILQVDHGHDTRNVFIIFLTSKTSDLFINSRQENYITFDIPNGFKVRFLLNILELVDKFLLNP